MLEAKQLLDVLARAGLCDWIGVPDSTLATLLAAREADARFTNLAATNECEAVAVALGKYLATGRPALVYLQNSGFGKTIHPITSLLAEEICRVPVLLLIGWRGAPDGPRDEPQHAKMGRIMPQLLDVIGVPFEVLGDEVAAIERAVDKAVQHMREACTPFALVVRPGLLAEPAKPVAAPPAFSRRVAIESMVTSLPGDSLFVATTGKTARELFFIRQARQEPHDRDFYTVGGMGCASSVGLGVALATAQSRPQVTVCVLDGDGAALMQLGSLATIGCAKPENLLHVVLDNECHESTGGQPTISRFVDLVAIARACGYPFAEGVVDREQLTAALTRALDFQGLRFLRVKVKPGSDAKLGRPSETPRQNASAFLHQLGH